MTNFLLIVNTQSGSFDRETLTDVKASLEKAGHTVETAETRSKGDGAKLMAEADPEKTPSVIVAGGGGLVSEVIDVLMNRDDYDKFTFGIVPTGSLNVLALEMGLTEPAAAVAAICSGKVQKITLGQAKTPEGTRLFTVLAGAGNDTWAIKKLRLKLKECTGTWEFVKTFLRVAMIPSIPSVKAEIDGQPFDGDMICACNGKYYGGPFRSAELSDMAEDEFEVVILKKVTIFDLMKHIFSAPMKYLIPEMKGTIVKAKTLKISSAAEDYPLQIDGDVINTLPAEISVFPRRLSLYTRLKIDKK